MEVKFTKEQQEAIFDDGHNLLVSASAGSGKTTVMIERIIELLLKYKDSENPLSITNFLVVTFTKSSASDMKQKLIAALSKMPQDEFVIQQIEKVAISDISNLHSFCSRLISTYFYEVGIDPSAFVIDDTEASFLKNKALDKLFDLKEKSGDLNFFELFDIFQKKRSDVELREIIKRFNSNLKENIDGEKWLFDSLEKYYNCDLDKNDASKLINTYAVNLVNNFKEEIEEMTRESAELGIDKLTNYLVDLSSIIGCVRFGNSYVINAKNVFEAKIKTAPKLGIEFLDIETRAKDLASRIKVSFENLKANFISSDEEILKFGITKTKEIILKLYALVKEFDLIYQNLKREINGMDFNDLEHFALKILSNQEICTAIKKKYRYVLVDEYQDINSVQEKIISLVSSSNNRFMVGDVKQSIYRFRFCDPDIFLEKFALYDSDGIDSKLIKLNCNFRSDKKILKMVDYVFCGVMTNEFGEYDYKKNAMFVAGDNNFDNENSANLCFINVPKIEETKKKIKGVYSVKNHIENVTLEQNKSIAEAVLVANKISSIMAIRNDVTFEDFAILVSSRNENIDKFVETLKSFNIPVVADKKYDLMKMSYIQEIVNFVKLSSNHNDDFVLFKVLKSRIANFSDNELAQIRLVNKMDRFYEVFYNFENYLSQNNKKLVEKVLIFKEKLNKFSRLAKLMQIKDFVSVIIDEFDLELINMASENGLVACKDIDTFLKLLPKVDVFDYVNFYSDYSMNLESECVGNAVKVMTIHKSKGLEFKFVFLINLSNEFNFKSTYKNVLFNKTLGIGMDAFDINERTQISTIPISAIRMIEKRKLVEEQQRVLYVAMTRAVEKLFIICTENLDKLTDKFPNRPTAFIDWFSRIIKSELAQNHQEFINFERFEINDLLSAPKKETYELVIKNDGKKQKVDWFSYAYSYAQNIPLKNSISKILATANEDITYEEKNFDDNFKSSADRGTIYHKFLQKINLQNLDDIDNQINEIFNLLTQEEINFIDIRKITDIFKLDFFKQISSDDIIFKEREFYAKMPASMINSQADDDFIMQGVIDLLVLHENEAWVLDYKTGKFSEEKMQKYKFQIETYANVIERAFARKVTRKIICFIDEQKNIEF